MTANDRVPASQGKATRGPHSPSIIRGRSLAGLALVLGAMALAPATFAAGIESHTYTCADLQRLIAAKGFVFIGAPDFGDFVVADASYCGGGAQVQLRSVPTTDRAECIINYCVPASGGGIQ